MSNPTELTHYLAGPMTGIPEYNYPLFEYVAGQLRDLGCTVYSPHEAAWPEGHDHMAESDLWEYMMKATDKLLEKCNSIILLPGWANSRGAKQELKKALDRNFQVFIVHGDSIISCNEV